MRDKAESLRVRRTQETAVGFVCIKGGENEANAFHTIREKGTNHFFCVHILTCRDRDSRAPPGKYCGSVRVSMLRCHSTVVVEQCSSYSAHSTMSVSTPLMVEYE